MSKRYDIHVVSNTHWDREWLTNFQETRMMLVEMVDELLDILDEHPGYRSFLMDSQAVPLEDYLEVRPEQRERVKKHVSRKRILVGPWYTDPECFCVNGESLVRNLLYGHRAAEALGHVMKVGHTPFSYGQNSQMPQIYKGFGIDTILFYHGVSHERTPNEFIYEGADGTQILGSQMSSGARYNFYHNVYRAVAWGETIDEREYSWRQGGLPFRFCSEAHGMGQHLLLDPRKQFIRKAIGPAVRKLFKAEKGVATTSQLGFMQGHDSSLPDAMTLQIIEDAEKHLKTATIRHSSLPDYMDQVKKEVKDLVVLKGEQRTPDLCDVRIHLYSDVLSGRTRMKRANAHAEFLLQRWAEPSAAVAWCLGQAYPESFLDLAWTTLLKCHAHDSIAGSGVDDIERDMFDRLRQVTGIANSVKQRALATVQQRIDNSDAGEDDVLLTVFNPSPYVRSEVVTAVVDLPETSGFRLFSIAESGSDDRAPVQLRTRHPHHNVVNHAGNATMMMTCDRATFHFEAKDLPPMGYAAYRLVPERLDVHDSLVCGRNAMENEHLKVRIESDGTLAVLHKETGATFDKQHYFEDGGEAGHAWMHIEPGEDRIITSLGCPVTIALEENGPLLARYRVTCQMRIPAGLDENRGDPWKRLDGAGSPCRRTAEERDLVITSLVTLRKGARSVDVTTRFDNASKNHRLRVMFPTRIATDSCHVESAFDVVERAIGFEPGGPWEERLIDPTFPMQRFVDLSGTRSDVIDDAVATVGLAVINDGLREYEVTADKDRAVAVTLLRAYEVSLTTVSKRWDLHPEMELAQCLGPQEFRYAIYPHSGAWDAAEVYREAERVAVPLELAQAGGHGGDLPKRLGFLELAPANLILSALKRAEDGSGLVARVFNPTEQPVEGVVTCFRPIEKAELVSLEEKREKKLTPSGNELRLHVEPKQIRTVRLVLG
jgi:2-O-(6-phospho-alpha-D-mannosyl)-D-glycerate hydrolase